MTQPTEMSAGELRDAMANGVLRVAQVVEAHIERIRATHAQLNAVIFPLFEDAMKRARELDAVTARQGRLWGVPMTIKDQFFLHGTPTSCGLAHRSKQAVAEEGSLVARLREQGAIFLGKTSVPQLLVSYQCQHRLYGHARNPWNTDRSPGGSSGGEAAIIAAGGSPLGLGGDMGGSIRVPAHCCGIHGLKPTGGRFPNDDSPLEAGFVAGLAGFEGWVPQPGPMARAVDDLKLAMDTLLHRPIGAAVHAPPMPWLEGPIAEPEGIRVGFYTDDGFFRAAPALQRLVGEAKDALASLGLDVKPFEPPAPTRAIEIGLEMLGSDGGAWLKEALAGESPIEDIAAGLQGARIPGALRRTLAWLLRWRGQHHAARVVLLSGPRDSRTFWRLCAERTRYRSALSRAMDEQGVDVVLCPPYGLPATPIGSNRYGACTLASSYSALFNVVGMPAGAVAAGRIRQGEQSDRPTTRDRTEQEAAQIEQDSAGLPVGVQVAGRHWREDQVLAVMKALETHFRSQPEYPNPPVPV